MTKRRRGSNDGGGFDWLRKRYSIRHFALSGAITGIMIVGGSTLLPNRVQQLVRGLGFTTIGAACFYASQREMRNDSLSKDQKGGFVVGAVCSLLPLAFGVGEAMDSVTIHVPEDEVGFIFEQERDYSINSDSVQELLPGFHAKSPFLEEGHAKVGRKAVPFSKSVKLEIADKQWVEFKFNYTIGLIPLHAGSTLETYDREILESDYTFDATELLSTFRELLPYNYLEVKTGLDPISDKMYNQQLGRLTPGLEVRIREAFEGQLSEKGLELTHFELTGLSSWGHGGEDDE